MKNPTKKEMANKLGYEYLGKGISSDGDDGFIVREYGKTKYISIANTVVGAYDWLMEKCSEIK